MKSNVSIYTNIMKKNTSACSGVWMFTAACCCTCAVHNACEPAKSPLQFTHAMIQLTLENWNNAITLQEINISPWSGIFEDDFPFPQVGYVSSLEGNIKQEVNSKMAELLLVMAANREYLLNIMILASWYSTLWGKIWWPNNISYKGDTPT